MGNITIKLNDEVEDRLREYIWRKHRGKGKHMGEVVAEALTEFLDKHEDN